MPWIFPWCEQKAYTFFIGMQLKVPLYIINQDQFHFLNILSVYDSIIKLKKKCLKIIVTNAVWMHCITLLGQHSVCRFKLSYALQNETLLQKMNQSKRK